MKTKDYNKSKLWFDRLLSKNLFQQFALLALVLVVAFGISYLMLYITFDNWKEFCDKRDISEWLLPLYLLIDSNALNGIYYDHPEVEPWMLFVSSLTFIFGAFIFNGAIIGIITNAIERRVTNHRKGHIHYLKSGHHIIMGYDDMVPSIINHIFAKDVNALILLLTTNDADSMREKLQKMFNDDQLKQIIINYGNRTSTYFFKGIHLESSEQIFIVGDRTSSTHDARNVECVDCIRQYLNRPEITQRPKRITCVFDDLDTFAAFKTTEIFNEVRDLGIEFIPYNFYTGWAKQVFVKRCYKDMGMPDKVYFYPAVYGKGYTKQDPKALTPDDPKYVHLVFVGTTNFAVAFAMEAAQTLHFPNFNKNNELKTRITFIDLNADVEKDEFITRNRHFFEVQSYYYRDFSKDEEGDQDETDEKPRDEYVLFKEDNGYDPEDANFLDVEFEFIKGNVFSHRVQKEIQKWANDTANQYLSIFLAQSNQRQNFVLAMNMPDKVYNNAIPIFIRQDRSDNFVTDLREADSKKSEKGLTYYCVNDKANLEEKTREARYANIYPFGMNETAFSADDNSIKRAKLINYLYTTADYSSHQFKGILALDSMPESQIWEEADAAWQELSVALKWSNLYCAYTIRTKLATLRSMRKLALDDPSLDAQALSNDEVQELAKVEHNRWNVEKLLMGFRKAFKEEDKHRHDKFANKLKNNKKLYIHHDIRQFGGLDDIQKLDEEFSRYIPWIMRMTNKNDR